MAKYRFITDQRTGSGGFLYVEVLVALILWSLLVSTFGSALINLYHIHHLQYQQEVELIQAENLFEQILAGQPVSDPALSATMTSPTLIKYAYTFRSGFKLELIQSMTP